MTRSSRSETPTRRYKYSEHSILYETPNPSDRFKMPTLKKVVPLRDVVGKIVPLPKKPAFLNDIVNEEFAKDE